MRADNIPGERWWIDPRASVVYLDGHAEPGDQLGYLVAALVELWRRTRPARRLSVVRDLIPAQRAAPPPLRVLARWSWAELAGDHEPGRRRLTVAGGG